MSPHPPAPRYLEIAAHYRDLIAKGDLRDGDRLPSVRDLATTWRVAHATAAKVVRTLLAESLVMTQPGGGGGTVVSARHVALTARGLVQAARRWGRMYPAGESSRIVSAELVCAPPHIADAMGVDQASQVIRRHRVACAQSTPVAVSTSWLPGELHEVAPGLLGTDPIPEGTVTYIERQTGRAVRHGRDQLTAGPASKDVAAELRLVPGTPVVIGRSWWHDARGDLIEFGEYVSAPGRWHTYDYS